MFQIHFGIQFFYCFILAISFGIQVQGKEVIKLFSQGPPIDIASYAEILDNPSKSLTFSDIQSSSFQGSFIPLKDHNSNHEVEWVKFTIDNHLNVKEKVRISVAFSDVSTIYVIHPNGPIVSSSGDLLPFYKRKVNIGQICFLEFSLPEKEVYTCYVRLLSTTSLSHQFKDFSVQSLKIYPEKAFYQTFEKTRIYQAFFYGAVIIMLCFNFFIFLSTRSSTYFYYLIYLSFLILFLSSNSGYLLELIFPGQPKTDLYIRFLSAPLLIISYLQFSKDYLRSESITPSLSHLVNILIGLLVMDCLVELLGFWRLGRSCFIVLSIASFLIILFIAIRSWQKGYGPARYFLAGNILLIIGGIAYALEHLFKVSQNSTAGLVLQNTVLIEVALFSLGLADRINVVRKELGKALLDQEIRNKEVEIEKKNLIAEKNLELEISNKQLDTFIYRTAHDIRGPLASLMGLCQVALIDVQDSASLLYLNKLNYSANKMNFILGRLQIASEISNSEVKKEIIQLKLFVENILHDLRFLENFGSTSIQLEVPSDLTIFSDATLLKFIVMNVIENAIKFQKAGSNDHIVQIGILKNDRVIVVDIVDNGVGISKEEETEIYNLFSKAASKYQTPGMGLYMVKSSLEKLNGKITHQTKNGFTKFSLEFPFD